MTRTGNLTDAEPARRHIRELMAAGVAYARIAQTAGVATSTINHLLYERPNRGCTQRLNHDNARRILAVQAHHVVTGRLDATGSTRRLQALMAVGWPPSHLGTHIGLHPHYVCEIQRTPTVYATTAHALAVTYNQLWDRTPERHGVTAQAANRFRNQARNNGWAPPAAWDDAAIDNPDAHPDWTGHCGTDRGWWTHRTAGQTPCPRCQEAHDQWRATNAGLTAAERARVMGKARAQAAGREAAIAEDGAELFAQGYDRHQIAERLGITLSHLDHSMARHPEKAGADADQVAA